MLKSAFIPLLFTCALAAEVALRWGYGPDYSLLDICQKTNASIILLGGYEAYNLLVSSSNHFEYNALGGGNSNDIRYCLDIAKGISDCQAMGKKVLLSLGLYRLLDRGDANDHAKFLWNVFGSRNPDAREPRPFGGVAVDGIHIDWPPESGELKFYYREIIRHFREMQQNMTIAVLAYITDLETLPRLLYGTRVDYMILTRGNSSTLLSDGPDARSWSAVSAEISYYFPQSKWFALVDSTESNSHVNALFLNKKFSVDSVGDNFGGIVVDLGFSNHNHLKQASNFIQNFNRLKASAVSAAPPAVQ